MSDANEIVRASDEHAAAPLPASVGVGQRRAARAAASPHSNKFRAVTAALVGVAIGAVLVAITILANESTTARAAPWSAWSPTDSGTLGAREIADHLAPSYRITWVDQLDVVTVVNLANGTASTASTSSTSGLQVAVRADPSSSQVSLLSGNTIGFNLCGIGSSNCSIRVGQPSTDRLLLLRREALELALYTFKYISGVQNVVAILPPGNTTQASTLSPKPPPPSAKSKVTPVNIAVLFVRDELKPWLSQPLSSTLPQQPPPMVGQLGLWRRTPEAALVDLITGRGLFSQQLVQAQDGSNLIVLDQLPPQ